MIPLVRVHAESDQEPAGLAELVCSGAMHVLQLDYVRPRAAPLVAGAMAELPELADSFRMTLPKFCRRLFLETDFRIITSAGWGNSYGAVENLGRVLVEGGSPDVLLSAVRGSNLLGIFEFLVADGLRLDHAVTGAPWSQQREPVLAADLQLGAGPLVTALGEGARVVVAGCYDGAAPTIAAGIQEFGWQWRDWNKLAGAAAAARAAIWPHRHASESLASLGALPALQHHPRIEFDEHSAFTVDLGHPLEANDGQRLLEWLQAGKANDAAHLHADVRMDATAAVVTRSGPTQLRVEGCTGAKADGSWRLEILYQAGFVAETVIEFSEHAPPGLRQQVAQAFQSRFVDAGDEHSLVTAQELVGQTGDAGPGWLHLACRAKNAKLCVEFSDQVTRFAAANPSLMRLPVGRPAVQVDCGLWPARVPRDAIDVAVDTRPAKEWV